MSLRPRNFEGSLCFQFKISGCFNKSYISDIIPKARCVVSVVVLFPIVLICFIYDHGISLIASGYFT